MSGRIIAVIAESREKADHIAAALSLPDSGSAPRRGRYEGDLLLLSWAQGHCLERKAPDEVSEHVSWSDPSTLLPLPEHAPLKTKKAAAKAIEGVRKALHEAHAVWMATDPDREGEAIGWELLEHLRCKLPVERVVLDESLSPEAIRRAVAGRIPAKQRLGRYYAQQARSMADWYAQYIVRAYTALARSGRLGKHLVGGRGRASVFPFGRVQSPTLRMIVERERAIRDHCTQIYYQLTVHAGGYSVTYQLPELDHYPMGIEINERSGKPMVVGRPVLESLVERLNRHGELEVERAQSRKRDKHPPPPHSLTTLQREMSRRHRLSSAKTLAAADALRMRGYLTYPRTEHGELPVSMYDPETLKALLRRTYAFHPEPSRQAVEYACDPDQPMPRCFTEKPMEHHGIIPGDKAPARLDELEPDQRHVYLACIERFIQALLPPAKLQENELRLKGSFNGAATEQPCYFRMQAQRLLEPGYLAVFEGKGAQAPMRLPERGIRLPVEGSEISEHETQPPKPFTQDTLLGAMHNAGRYADSAEARETLREHAGIGTPATRHTVIDKLQSYRVISAKLRAEPKGEAVIEQLPDQLSSVEMTAKWEQELAEIALAEPGSARHRRDRFIEQQRKLFTEQIQEAVKVMETVAAEAPAGGGREKPTTRMLTTAKKVAECRGIKLPKRVRESFNECRAWLDEQMSVDPPPTPGMVELARKIADERNEELPDEVLQTFETCKQWLDARTAERKATQRMLSVAHDIAEREGVSLPDEIESWKVCKAFLDEHLGGSGKSS